MQNRKFIFLQPFFKKVLLFTKFCAIIVAFASLRKRIWKRIEVVITGLTRNQLYLTVPWVRIPPLPPMQGAPLGAPFALAEAVVPRNLVRTKCARGEFALQICASIVCNRGLVQNPTVFGRNIFAFGKNENKKKEKDCKFV